LVEDPGEGIDLGRSSVCVKIECHPERFGDGAVTVS